MIPRPTVIAASHLPGEEPHRSENFQVRPIECKDEYSYWQGLRDLWQTTGTLLNVEHDMEFSDELVQGLLDCPHPLCSYAYRVWMVGLTQWVYCPTRGGHWIGQGDEWADTASLGFCKIAASARERVPIRMPWKFLEHSICNAVGTVTLLESIPDGYHRPVWDETRWHIHWPEIGHFHDYDAEVYSRLSDWEKFAAENGEPCHVVPSEVPGAVAERVPQLVHYGGGRNG